MAIKIALPKGRLLEETADLLQRAGWGLSGYHKDTRLYRLGSNRFPALSAKVFHEKDVPIQVAIGNYDLGVCGLDWIEELLVKYPSSALVKVKDLGYGGGVLYLVGCISGGLSSLDGMGSSVSTVRIASEYPNLAESLALNLRFRRFSVFPLWGGAEVYPPESADLALIPGRIGESHFDYGLLPLSETLRYSAFLIANRDSWETKDMSEVLSSLEDNPALAPGKKASSPAPESRMSAEVGQSYSAADRDAVRLALPDGHQQQPTLELLVKAGIQVDDYPSLTGNRRPVVGLDGVVAKLIRPQDMPLQVANGNFDLAITGRDWVREHLYQFPSSPITELLDLKFGWVKIVAVVVKDLPVSDIDGLRQLGIERTVSFRVASEYVNIADKYARDNHLGSYRIVPTWGATEAFLPEDADLLIENTQTGQTLAKNNLKIIDTLFQSTACLIGRTGSVLSSVKRKRMDAIIESLRYALGGT
ncbi:MAG: ATP phosphoribosyltransferase [Dehalococcoidales bacterium]|nr:ATP phosphoribosyltransferase [Dehalococcoidales bacterium]